MTVDELTKANHRALDLQYEVDILYGMLTSEQQAAYWAERGEDTETTTPAQPVGEAYRPAGSDEQG